MRNNRTDELASTLSDEWRTYLRKSSDKLLFINSLEGLIGEPRIEKPKAPQPLPASPSAGPKVYYGNKLMSSSDLDKLLQPVQETRYSFELFLDGEVFSCWSYGNHWEFHTKL